MRLDVYLHEKNIFQSREKARTAIKEEAVSVNGKIVTKPAFEVTEEDKIDIVRETNPFVGRGGLKLKGAIDSFGLDLSGVKALDIGASTGGFTDCLLKNNAQSVCAVDVGSMQMIECLKNDYRVLSLENTDIRDFAVNPKGYGVDYKFDFVCVDVSFISLTKILPHITGLIEEGADIVCLVKPQFELDKKRVGKNGVIRDSKVHKKVIEGISEFVSNTGFKVKGIIDSPIKGGDGNKEFLMLLNMA